MFSHTRIAAALAVLIALITSVTAFAKGGFAFVAISGPNLKDMIRATNPELTTDFFAFADFYSNKAEAPTNAGTGFEVTRFYIDNSREVAFDRLHYYPETGFVFYDGIMNGSSEYDGKWYTARWEIKTAFEKAIYEPIPAVAAVAEPVKLHPFTAADSTQPSISVAQPQAIIMIVITLGFVLIFAFAFRRRHLSIQ